MRKRLIICMAAFLTLVACGKGVVEQARNGSSRQNGDSGGGGDVSPGDMPALGLTVTLEQASAQADPTNALPIAFIVTFNRAIVPASFTVDDISTRGTATATSWTLTNTGDDRVFTLEADAVNSEGTVEGRAEAIANFNVGIKSRLLF